MYENIKTPTRSYLLHRSPSFATSSFELILSRAASQGKVMTVVQTRAWSMECESPDRAPGNEKRTAEKRTLTRHCEWRSVR